MSKMGGLSEDDDLFFDSRDEITSVSDSSSDIGENSDSESRISGDLMASFGYEVWIKSPGTILERRHRLLKLMGVSVNETDRESSSQDLEADAVEIDTNRILQDSGPVLGSSLPDMLSSSQSSISCCSTDSSDLFGGALDENSVFRIRNLDNGTEFIVDELGHDGILNRLREVGSNRLVTGKEFERILGLSPLVQWVMRKDAGQASNSYMGKRKAKKGWLRRLGAAACIADVRAGLGSMETDGCGCYPVAQAGLQAVRVHTYRKRAKELSALYLNQDIVGHDGAILTMKFSPDGQLLASAGEDGIVRIWQVTETQRSHSLRISGMDSRNIYFLLNDQSELVPMNMDKEKRSKLKGLWKSSESSCVILPQRVFHIEEKPLHEFHGHCGEVLDLSWSKDKFLLSSSVDKTVRLWRAGSDHCLQVFSHNNYVTCVQFNPVNENYFISGSIDGKVRIWAVSGCEVVDWTDIKEIVTAVCFEPDGKRAIVGSMSGDCFFFDTSDNRLQLVDQMCLQGKKKSPSGRITGLQFSPVDSSKLMVTSADSHVRILQGGVVICKYRGIRNTGSQISASFTPDGTHIVSASEDSNVYVWDYVNPERPISSHVKSTWSCERFFSNNASIAIPWCGMPSGNSIFSSETRPSGIIVKYMAESGAQRLALGESSHSKFPPFLSDALSLGLSESPFSRGSATWPEEKLTDSASLVVSSIACRSEYKFVKTTCQNMAGSHHAWGSVFVSAGWDGRIRVFQNYGLPVHV